MYYGLYSLERASVLAGRRHVGSNDWYRQGARWLMQNQTSGGGWTGRTKSAGYNAVMDTAFALLFLTKATVPPRVKVTKGGR